MGEVITRKGPNGERRHYIRYTDSDGRRKMRASQQQTREGAKKVLAEVEARIMRGTVGIPEPTPEEQKQRTITLDAVADAFLAGYAPPRLKDLERYRVQARSALKSRVRAALGARAAASITHAEIERLCADLTAAGYAPNTLGETMRVLSRVYYYGNKTALLKCPNPVTGVELPQHEPSLDFLDVAEVGRLLDVAEARAAELEPGMFAMVATAVYAGLRKGELFGLRWIDLHLDSRRLTVARSYRGRTKSGKTRHVRIHPELQRILRTWREQCPKTLDGLVFPVAVAPGGSNKAHVLRMGNTSDMLGLEELLTSAECHVPAKPWHALRHTFASHFVMAGGNILSLQKLLGHATLTMTLIYAHLAPDFMDAEICRLSFPRPVPEAGVADLGDERRRRAQAEGAPEA